MQLIGKVKLLALGREPAVPGGAERGQADVQRCVASVVTYAPNNESNVKYIGKEKLYGVV